MKKYKFHVDPGHGWLEVSISEIVNFGLARNISTYSYRKDNTVYLEEDCDAPKFINRWETVNKKKIENHLEFIEHDKINSPNCFIRELENYYF